MRNNISKDSRSTKFLWRQIFSQKIAIPRRLKFIDQTIKSKWTSKQNFTPDDQFKLFIIWLKPCSSFDRTLFIKIFSFSTHSFGFVHEFRGKGNHNGVDMKNDARLRWKLFITIILNPKQIIATFLIEYPNYFHCSPAFSSPYGPINYQNQAVLHSKHAFGTQTLNAR